MARIYTKETSATQLLTGVLGTIDIGATVAEVAKLQMDLEHAKKERENLSRIADILKTEAYNYWFNRATLSPEKLVSDAKSWLESALTAIRTFTWDELMYSAGGFRVSANMVGMQAKFNQMLFTPDVAYDIIAGIPQQKATEKAERYWNKLYAPNLPSERDMFMLYRVGKKSKEDFINRLREVDGLTVSDAENIAELREWQTGVPSLSEAYFLYRIGYRSLDWFKKVAKYGYGFSDDLISDLVRYYDWRTGQPSLRDAYLWYSMGYKNFEWFKGLATKGFGFRESDVSALIDVLDYNPSISEMLRLSDLVPLPSEKVDEWLDELGVPVEDKEIYKSALEKRVVRDEINKAWNIILENAIWGLHTDKEVSDLLEKWNFGKQEIKTRLDIIQLGKLKLRVKLLRDAEIYLYRQGKITENDLLTKLVNLGISKDIANAIVRLEAAKKGVEWEIPEG